MAKFTLSLINLKTSGSKPTYFKQTISEFYSQRDEYISQTSSTPLYSYCYTYNEKFSETTNSQKRLSFSMDRKIIRDDRIEENPFVYNLAIGSQLLLEDKYGQHHLMTITDIQFDFKEINMVYNYQCQDSFTWQLSRQNNGYEIVNDPASDDFIGALSVDDWAKRICNDCNIIYQYKEFLSLEGGSPYRNYADYKKTIPFSGSGTANSLLISLGEQYGLQLQVYEYFNNNDNTITKEFRYIPLKDHHPSGLKYSPYQDIQSFGLSHTGTSLASIMNVQSNEVAGELVSLIPSVPTFFKDWFTTDEWRQSKFVPGLFSSKCQSKIIELLNGNRQTCTVKESGFDTYQTFICTPDNHSINFAEYKGNEYSSTFDFNFINTFDWTYNTFSLIYHYSFWSDLNGKYVYQLDGIYWYCDEHASIYLYKNGEKTSDFNQYSTVVIKNYKENKDFERCFTPSGECDMVFTNITTTTLVKDQSSICIPLTLNHTDLQDYDYLSFSVNNSKKSHIYIEQTTDNGVNYKYHYNTDTLWRLCCGNDKRTIRAGIDKIPEDWKTKDSQFYVVIPGISPEPTNILNQEIYINFYRNPTEEELEFAAIADQCPWLENKLINFDYFYNHHIITQAQYKELQQKIQNDLRLASADLLYYSQAYYQAIKNKTEELAQLESDLDLVGATFNADFIQPYNNNKPFQSSDFILAYSNLTRNTNDILKQQINLIDYEKTLTSYLNNYISSEQNFLKNMYLFRQYFEEKIGNKELFTYTITLNNNTNNEGLVATFSYPESYTKVDSSFKYLSKDTPTTTLYQKEDSIYTPIANNDIITSENYADDDIYYLTALDSMYKLDSEKDDDDDRVIKDYEYNRDQQYFEKQWVITIDTNSNSNWALFKQPVRNTASGSSGMYELFKVDLYNGNAYIRSFNHIIQPDPSGALVWDLGENQQVSYEGGSIKTIYEPIDLFEMKCNWIMHNTNRLPGVYRKLDIPSKLVSNMASHIFTSDNYKANLIKHFPNTQNDYSGLDASDFDEYYAMNFSMPKFQYKKGSDYYNIDFVNYNNAATKYRRISVSNSGHVALDIITGASIATGVGGQIGVAAGMFLPGLGIAAGASMLLTYAIKLGVEHIWKHGNTTWGTEGWTYQDIQSEPMDGFNSSWYGGQRQVYVKTKDSWSCVENADNNSKALLTAQNFLYTYNSLDKTKNYYYKPTYWRFLGLDDYINPYDTYYMISTDTTNPLIPLNYDVAKINSRNNNTIDAVSNYPLSYIMNKLPVEDLDTSKRTTVRSILTSSKFEWDSDTSSWSGSDGGSGNIYIICEEDYIKSDLGYSDQDTNTDSIPTATNITELASATWYDRDGFKYDWIMNHKTTLADGFYIHKANENYLPAKEKPEDLGLDDVFCYRKDPTTGKMTRLYTFKQLASQGNVYYRSGDSVTFKTFNEQSDVSYSMNIYEHKDNKYTFKENRIIKFDLTNIENNQQINGIATTYKIKKETNNKIGNLTHGQFWATYKDSNESALLQEAMVIETNLTEYWTNAYYASKNCRYFLPQFWQPVVSGQINRFSGNITQQLDENTIILSSVFIPKVSISSKQPKFQYKYNGDTIQLSNESQTQYYTEDLVSKHYNSQPWLEDIIKYLDFKEQGDDKISVMILNNKASYYTRESGGTTWYEMLNNIGMNQYRDYDIFGGWYDMAIKVLKNKYQSYAATGYNEARRRHNQIWKEIYTQYPNLIYEQQYSNTDAINSSELLAAAQFAFKQYTDIERQYNIQTIDLASLKGYEGQHLRIGDAIELDADELYEEYDDIKTSLMQYLFISDISYDLRSDADIQLTVNNIKYSDKVIGELVKLIR